MRTLCGFPEPAAREQCWAAQGTEPPSPRPPCALVPPAGTCPIRRDGVWSPGWVGWLRRAKVEPGAQGDSELGRCSRAGGQGEPGGTAELAAAGDGGGEAGAPLREGCLQATGCHFVCFTWAAFLLSGSAVRGGGSSAGPVPALARPPPRRQPGASGEVPPGERPPASASPASALSLPPPP